MDLDAYLRRIGLSGPLRADLDTLRALMCCQLRTIPFENLDIFDFHRPVSLEPSALFDKLVTARRGGYCFELNGLFFEVLKAAGFACYPVAARVLWRKTVRPPLTHRASIVELDGEAWWCDVGFGGPGPREPLPLRAGEPLLCGADVFLLRPAGRELALLRVKDGVREPVLSFENRPFDEADFALLNYYCSHSPDVLFTRQRVVSLTTDAGYAAITGDMLCADGRETPLDTPDSLRSALQDRFGISIERGFP